MLKIVFLAASYFFASVPFGLLVSKTVKNIDIRDFGSGNIGATNVFRIVGKKWGVFVFILDFLKGFIPVVASKILFTHCSNYFFIAVAFAVVCGHNWTVFLKFRGGKGVATSLGAVSGLGFIFPMIWFSIGTALAGWIIMMKVFKYVSAASLTAGALFFLCSLTIGLPVEIKIFSFVLFVFIVIRHKKNIRSLLMHKEDRI